MRRTQLSQDRGDVENQQPEEDYRGDQHEWRGMLEHPRQSPDVFRALWVVEPLFTQPAFAAHRRMEDSESMLGRLTTLRISCGARIRI